MNTDPFFQKLYNWSLKYLELRPRSEKEIKDYLRLKVNRNVKKGWLEIPENSSLESVTEEVLQKLRNLKLVDDVEFTAAWVSSRGASRSSRILKGELFKKGIDREIVAAQFSGIKRDQSDLLKKLAAKAIIKYRNEEPRKAKQKLVSYLMRRGFEWGEIRPVVDELLRKG